MVARSPGAQIEAERLLGTNEATGTYLGVMALRRIVLGVVVPILLLLSSCHAIWGDSGDAVWVGNTRFGIGCTPVKTSLVEGDHPLTTGNTNVLSVSGAAEIRGVDPALALAIHVGHQMCGSGAPGTSHWVLGFSDEATSAQVRSIVATAHPTPTTTISTPPSAPGT